jgi:acetyl esterase/lipase
MLRTLPFATLMAALLITTVAAGAEPGEPIPLWPNGAPGARGTDAAKDIPTITPYLPAADKATGAAVVVCPGGGYGALAGHEGRDYALWLNERGVAAFVLKYRLGSHGYRHPAMLHDVQRAVRLVRSRAGEWKLDAARIGVMGSSAGGHLASTALTHFDAGQPDAADPVERVSSRPDLGILCYPVISMGQLGHAGSRKNLLGENPSPELVALLSSELRVTKDTPPTFVWHTRDDPVVDVRNALAFASALLDKGVPFDLHVYQTGRHGLGLGVRPYEPGKTDPKELLPWTVDLAYWLKLQGFAR